ncbi:hypothetical protein [Aquirufa regiilacus]|uniref:Lipoprotein n=2 Tax=Aquirufa regiilacus TaxID=3024868 RepID=A0ABU3TQ17_9BACT|nr:hypothetical protein [Aquirufa sp. LEOWEIH-7C]MDU0807958.1 hypothetical protein [Aquirufa sp. LEOWEIH-7C]
MKWISNYACFVLCSLTLAACYQTEKTKEIENIYRDISLSDKTQFKKGIGLINTNHVKNLEAEMLDEVFCYSPRLGGGAYFFIPTARMQNFGYVDLQPSDVVGGGGGGSPADLLMAQLSGPVPMVTIKDVHNPCLRATLEMVLHNTDILNEMSQMLHNFGFSTKIKLIFEESSELSSKRLGEFRNNHNNNSYRILLDVTNLPHYSKEVIVSSIYHEVLHAQLEFLFKETESQDHERMATEYLERAVNSLLKQFSNMNKDTAKALVFSGLKNTKIYQNLNQETKNQMYEIESNFKNRNYGTYCD